MSMRRTADGLDCTRSHATWRGPALWLMSLLAVACNKGSGAPPPSLFTNPGDVEMVCFDGTIDRERFTQKRPNSRIHGLCFGRSFSPGNRTVEALAREFCASRMALVPSRSSTSERWDQQGESCQLETSLQGTPP